MARFGRGYPVPGERFQAQPEPVGPVVHEGAATLAGVGALAAGAVREQLGAATLSGTGGLTAAGTLPTPKAHTLTDNFATEDTAKWGNYTHADISASGGTLRCAGTTAFAAAVSAQKYDLSDSEIVVEVVAFPTLYAFIQAMNDGSTHGVWWDLDLISGDYTAKRRVASVDTTIGTVFEGPTTRWLKIAAVGNVVSWYHSANGTSWTQLGSSYTASFSITSLWFVLGAGADAGSEGGVTQYDNFNLAPTGPIVHEGAVALVGAGALTAAAVPVKPGAATLAGVGALTTAAEIVKPGAATLAGAGQLSATAVRVQLGAATLAGAGQLTATALREQFGAAVLAGLGQLVAGAVREQLGAATLTGVASLTAAAVRELPGAAPLTGVGQLTATAEAIPAAVEYLGAAVLTGDGLLAATATVISYDHTGWLYAGTATEVAGTWVNEPNAVGPSMGDVATWTTDTAGTATLELAGFAAQTGIPVGSVIGPMQVLVRHAEDPADEIVTVTAQAYVGATPHGAPITLTVDPAIHEDIVTVTDLDWADLADLRVQVTAVR